VPQDPNDEPAGELLNKIAAEKARLVKEGKVKKEKPLSEIQEQELNFKAPSGWAWSRIGDLAHFQKGYAFKSEEYLKSGLMITKIQNLNENNNKNSVYMPPERSEEFEKYRIFEGDIVMTTVGSWFSAPASAVGRSFQINKLFDGSLLNQNAVRIRAWSSLTPTYLFTCINSLEFKIHLTKEAQGTANQASITQESIKNFLICVPPENEQHRIVAKVDQLMALCDQLKNHLTQARQLNEQLASTLVEQAVA
jgi:type I restriction enzyme S subunit